MMLSYIVGLLVGITGMAVLDWRYKLAFWHSPKQTWIIVLITILVFIAWDAAGIMLGIFLKGKSPYQLPFELAPHFPLEELFFLFLLAYCTLVIYRGVGVWRSRI